MDPEFFAIGNAVQVCAMSGIYGMTMAVANSALVRDPAGPDGQPGQPRRPVRGRFIPFIVNGFLVSPTASSCAGSSSVRFDAATLGVMVLAMIVTAFSCSAIGAVQGGMSLRLRDGLFGANLLVFLFLLFCG